MNKLTKIDISISMLSFNTKPFLENCLNSIYKNTHNIRFEILLVDNYSHDGTVRMIRKKFPQVLLISNKANKLFVKGHNQNLIRVRGRYFLVLNEDTEIGPKVLEKMVRLMNANPKIGLTSCRQVDEKGKVDTTCSKFPHPLYDIFEATYLGKFLRRIIKIRIIESALNSYHYVDWNRATLRKVDVLPGSFLMGRSSFLKKNGLLDEKLLFFYGEADYCQRAKAAGFEVVHNGKVTIKHLRGKGLAKLDPSKRNALVQHDMLTYYRKYFSVLWQPILWLFLKSNWLTSKLK